MLFLFLISSDDIYFAKMSCSTVEEKALCKKSLVLRYPSLRVFVNADERAKIYDGHLDAKVLVDFISHVTGMFGVCDVL